ncbi:MAG: hypothetical protein AAF191_11025, partial [Verrucomicrobiota bacterium]
FTEPMRQRILNFVEAEEPEYIIISSEPRIVDGKPTKNPRYLQDRPDLDGQRAEYLAEVGARLFRRLDPELSVPNPVNAVLPGRRNNPAEPEAGIRPLAVYNPIHYQELPELFMDFIASLTGKSPSTTGAGSEGALTKGPFNALRPITDLNNALVSYLLAGYPAYSTAAGWIGSKYRVDHDISLIIPEVWCRMFIPERDPAFLMEKGYLEPVEDFEHQGEKILGSRLGYRITSSFVHYFFGRVFTEPSTVFPDDMLRPELQNMDEFADGVKNIVETQERIARLYFEDGSIEIACPPLRALLTIMAEGSFEGMTAQDSEIRKMFTRDALLESDWYQARLQARLEVDRALMERQVSYAKSFLSKTHYQEVAPALHLSEKLGVVEERLNAIRRKPQDELERLRGTLGTDPAML